MNTAEKSSLKIRRPARTQSGKLLRKMTLALVSLCALGGFLFAQVASAASPALAEMTVSGEPNVLNVGAMKITSQQIVLWFACFSIACSLFLVIRKFENGIRGGGEKREITGQPLKIMLEEQFVKRSDFSEYAKTNMAAQEKLERRMDFEISRMSKELHGLSREMSGQIARSELNGQQLAHIHAKVDRIVEALNIPKSQN